MSYLSIAQSVARAVGTAQPTTMQDDDPDAQKIGQFINEAGQEVARRVDWAALRKIATVAGPGTPSLLNIANDFDRLARGLNVVRNGEPVRGSLTPDEWMSLEPVEGEPRYFFLNGKQIGFYPFLPASETLRVQYQSRNWVDGGGDEYTVGTQVALIPESLIEAGAIWRWRRAAGKDFTDHLAEFEAALADRAQFDGGVRIP